MNVLDKLPKPFFVLAPMDDVTDTVFRQVVADCAAPDLYFTEFVNVDGLQSPGRDKLMKKLQFTAKERPIIAQVWGLVPENYRKTAVELVQMGFDGIDINMGCPDKTVVKNGACAGLMHNRELAVEIIKATQEGAAGKVPVSVKTRLGFNSIDLTWPTLLLQQKINMLTIHGRTRKEMSKVPAQWDEIGKIRELRDQLAPATLVVGNGDVESYEQGLALAKTHKLDGIMVGRGIFHDPFVFSGDSPWETYSTEQKIELYTKHVKLFAKTWKNGERAVHTLNKFCKVYINGFDGAKELREQLMSARSAAELLQILEESRQLATAG
ncbi:MAG TPA: tRNA-dihydrouridine synthase [Candidatus Saccharimonadales bacterium]|nr:tRNA-dihydrouridine synthase [Candidatus Saccharimonadales bacterium]